MIAEIAAICCGVILMLIVVCALLIAVLVKVADRRARRHAAEVSDLGIPQHPLLIIDPLCPGLAIDEHAQLITTPNSTTQES